MKRHSKDTVNLFVPPYDTLKDFTFLIAFVFKDYDSKAFSVQEPFVLSFDNLISTSLPICLVHSLFYTVHFKACLRRF